MYRRVPAGEMRHTITIYRHKIETGSTVVDEYGQLSTSTTAKSVVSRPRAKVEQLAGDELELARQTYPEATYRATIDYIASLDSTGGTRRSITVGTKTLHIGAVINPDLENRQLQLLCGAER